MGETRIEENKEMTMKPSEGIILCEDGAYRWAYDLNLFTNPTILLMIWKIFGFICFGLWVFITLLSLGDHNFWWDGFLESLKVFGIFLGGMFALSLLGYLVYAIIQGGKYCVLFEMDEQGVSHTQVPKQFKKAQIMATILGLTASGSGKIGTLGTAILAGSKSSSYTRWEYTRSVYCYRHTHVIKVNELMQKNQVYASKEDFDFVRNYIVTRCTKAKIKG